MGYNVNEFREVLEFCQECPELSNLWAMSIELNNGDNSLELADSSNLLNVEAEPYTDNRTKLVFTPIYPYYNTYYLVLYRILYPEDNITNSAALSAMDEVCKWFFEAQESGKVPNLSSEACVKLELITPRALKRMAYEDANGQIIQDFYIAFRLHKVNPSARDVRVV